MTEKTIKAKQKHLKFKHRTKKSQARTFSQEELKLAIMCEARALSFSLPIAEVIADSTANSVAQWVMKRPAITEDDLNRRVAKEIAKYNDDLAYVYQNRGKII